MIRRSVLSALLLFAAPSSPAQAADDLHDPLKLFHSVCMADEASIPKDALAEQSYETLPAGPKNALGFSKPAGGVPRTAPPFALPASEVPNRIWRILPKGDVFLLVPASDTGSYASSCVVVWRGNHYAEAVGTARAIAFDGQVPQPARTLGTGIAGFNYSVFQNNGMIIGVAELEGWTVLRVAPDLSPPAEQTNQ